MAQARPSRTWRRRALLLAGSLGFALLAAELLLRLCWSPPSVRSTQATGEHPVYGFAPLPGLRGRHCTSEYEATFSHSAQGLRAAPVFGPRPAAGRERRLLLLGDSFTYGLGVDDGQTFAALLASALPDVEIANTGCNGYSTREQLAVLDHFGAAFRPELTVLVFFWNDLEDNLLRSAPAFVRSAGGGLRRLDEPAVRPPALALLPPAPAESLSPWRVSYLAALWREGLRGLRYRWFGLGRRGIRTPADAARAWAITDDLLGMLARRCRELGSDLLVVSLPDHQQVDPTAAIPGIEPLHFAVQQRLAEACARWDIACLDLLPALQERFAEDHRPLFFFADRHLTAAGNAAVAELLAEPLRRRIAAAAPQER